MSKTLLHESIVEYAAELLTHKEPTLWIHVIEWIFLFTGGMTIAYMTKLFVAVFIEEHPIRQREFDEKKHYMNIESIFALLVPAIILVIMGLLPYLTMNQIADLAQSFLHGEAPAHAVHYFSFGNLKGAVISLTIGVLVYFGFIRKFLMGKNDDQEQVYLNIWPNWIDIEDLIYRPVLQKAAITIVAGISRMIDQMYLTKMCLKVLLNICAFFSRICDHLMDGILLLFRSTTHRSKTEQHIYLIGSKLSRTLGRILDNCVKVLNRTLLKNRSIEHSFVVTFAEWEEVMRKTNRLISASLSFGLMLCVIGLAMTLVYLLWW